MSVSRDHGLGQWNSIVFYVKKLMWLVLQCVIICLAMKLNICLERPKG